MNEKKLYLIELIEGIIIIAGYDFGCPLYKNELKVAGRLHYGIEQ